ncbi:MAG: hypothetical protein WAM14_14695 [Candidatus Nitrosopolaris sp.]
MATPCGKENWPFAVPKDPHFQGNPPKGNFIVPVMRPVLEVLLPPVLVVPVVAVLVHDASIGEFSLSR